MMAMMADHSQDEEKHTMHCDDDNNEDGDHRNVVPDVEQNQLIPREGNKSGLSQDCVEVQASTESTNATVKNRGGGYFEDNDETNSQQHMEDRYSTFNETIYTLLYMSKPSSIPFAFALTIFLLQAALILLVLFDTVDLWAETNKLKIPPNVDSTVHWGQGMILVFAVAFQQDFVEAVIKWHNGPNPAVDDPNTSATLLSFHGSTVAQMMTGCSLLLAIFILTMQATTVVGMMLNFAALHFLSELDDISFRLAKSGFVHSAIEDEIDRILSYKTLDRSRNKEKFWRHLFFYSVVTLLLSGYSVLKLQQVDGAWLCDRIYVQFGDAFNPQLAHFSGVYRPQDRFTFHTRDYVDTLTGENILLAYCDTEQRWTFSFMTEGQDSEDPCGQSFARSASTITYDVTSTSAADWMVRNIESDSYVPFDFFLLTCVDGDDRVEIGETGLLGAFSDPCEELQVDGRSEDFHQISASNPLANKFDLFKKDDGTLHTEYGMPMYFSDTVDPFNYIFFTGRRWVMVDGDNIFSEDADGRNMTTHDFHREFLRRGVHWAPLYFSDPTDYGTSSFRSTPVGLRWYPAAKVSVDDNGLAQFGLDIEQTPPETRLLCIECRGNHDVCLGDGYCDPETDRCVCLEDFTSGTCEQYVACYDQEIPCHGRGWCDEISGQCRCEPPRFGQLCENHYFCYEENGVCFHNSTCFRDADSFLSGTCDCTDPATFGDACETWNDCTVAGCSNGGVCDETSRECSCPSGYSGLLCDISQGSSCEQSLCRNGTECSSLESTAACTPVVNDVANIACTWSVDCFRCDSDDDCHNEGVCTESGVCDCQFLYVTGGNCGFLLTTTLFAV